MEIDLSGQWRFELDRGDQGVADGWYSRELREHVQLPGSLQAQGCGDDISIDTPWIGSIVDRSWYVDPKYERYRQPGNVKVPFWLQPEKYYAGVAWYQRDVDVPAAWANQRVVLRLERPHWETRVWIDDREIGSNRSLSTPHAYDLGTALTPGRHRLTTRIDNRLLVNVGVNAHSIYDGTQTNWNGAVGRLDLSAGSPIWMDDIRVYPDVANAVTRVTMRIGNAVSQAAGRLILQADVYNTEHPHTLPAHSIDVEVGPEGGQVEAVYPMGAAVHPWDEFSPALYRMRARLDVSAGGKTYSDDASVTCGMRDVGVVGSRLAINGRPIFLRGTLECCIFPLTGYPPTEVESWKRIIHICKAHGLNHIRFHSWCPPEAAFVAADELGFYYQVECGVWTGIGTGDPVDQWLYDEGARIIAAYGNHPSFLMMAHGNEPSGDSEGFLAKWVPYWKRADPRRFHTGGAGWPVVADNDYHVLPEPRIQHWEEGYKSRINARPPETCTDYRETVQAHGAPLVAHEIGQWCAYPNFDEIAKYTGPVKAKNFEIFREQLQANHMGDQARDFLMASGRLQVACYKEEIEAALRTPGFGGFQLLDLHDFPGQGTALIGVLDAFWDSKGYVTAEEFRRFCNTTVPLARLTKRTWHTGERFAAEISLAHAGPAPLHDAVAVWKVLDEGLAPIASGRFDPMTVPLETGIPVGSLDVPLGQLKAPGKYSLVVGLEATSFENDWDFWVYPQKVEPVIPKSVHIAERLDDQALAWLGQGGTVLWLPRAEQVAGDAALGFPTIFWNTAFTQKQPPHTLGILCDPAHPVFRHFPTESHSNWQWWELIQGAAAMVLDTLPPALRPLVQVIDDWFENRRLGLFFEARLGAGKLAVCSMDLQSDLDERLVARQFRFSLLNYLASDRFNPRVDVEAEWLDRLVRQ